jgi:hypothetical protein
LTLVGPKTLDNVSCGCVYQMDEKFRAGATTGPGIGGFAVGETTQEPVSAE